MANKNQQIELRDLFLKLSEYKKEILIQKFSIIKGVVIFGFMGVLGSFLLKTSYTSQLSFVVESKSSSPLASYASFASQFGIDMTGESSTFSQENVMEIIKSRAVIEEALMQKATINKSRDLLIEHYLIINNYKDGWEEKGLTNLMFNKGFISTSHDSILLYVWNEIVKEKLSVEFKSSDASIINLVFTSFNEEFAKVFVETLIEEIERLYVSISIEKAKSTLDYLNERADSIFNELQHTEREYARIKDINARIIKASGRLKELQLMRDVEILNTIYLELIKNIEISKLTLLNTTPIIQVIDKPRFPLEKNKISISIAILFGGFLGGFLSIFQILLLKFKKEIMQE